MILSIFSCKCCSFENLLWKMSVKFLWSFFNWISFLLLSCTVLYRFWLITPYQIYDFQTFSFIPRMSSHFLITVCFSHVCVFCYAEVFASYGLINAYFCCLCFLFYINKYHWHDQCQGAFPPMFSSRSFRVSCLMIKTLVHFELIFSSSRR